MSFANCTAFREATRKIFQQPNSNPNPINQNLTPNDGIRYFSQNQTLINSNSVHNKIEMTPSQKQFKLGYPILVRSLNNVPYHQLLINSNKTRSNNLQKTGGKTLLELARCIIPKEQHHNKSSLELNKLDFNELEFIYKKAQFECIKKLIKMKESGKTVFNIDQDARTEIKQVIDKIKLATRMPFDTTFNYSGSLICNYNTKLFYSDRPHPIALILDPNKINIYNAFIHSVATHNRLYLPEYVDGKTKVWHDIIEDYVDYVDINHDNSKPELLINDLQKNIQQNLCNKLLNNNTQHGNIEDNFLRKELEDNINEILFLPKNPESLDYICEIALDLSIRGEAINGDIEKYLRQPEQIQLIEKIKTQFPDTPLSVIYKDSNNSSSKLVLKGIQQITNRLVTE